MPFYDLGTQALVNYWAAYEYSSTDKEWVMQAESSFNTNASRPPCNLTAPHCGLDDATQSWLSPQPGGSMFWSLGYYPAGVREWEARRGGNGYFRQNNSGEPHGTC